MHPGQMIAFAIILDRQLVIGRKLQLKAAVCAAMVQRAVKFRPPRDEIGMNLSEFRCITRDIDEHDIPPDIAAHLIQAEIVFYDAWVGVVTRAADMRGGHQLTLGRIAPGVIGATDCSFDGFRFLQQLHAPVTANILKHPQLAVLVAN